jgi:hypothetical protein
VIWEKDLDWVLEMVLEMAYFCLQGQFLAFYHTFFLSGMVLEEQFPRRLLLRIEG